MNRHLTIVQHVNKYLQQRRSLGYDLKSQGEMLLNFARYLDHSGHRGPFTTEVALRWVNLPQNPSLSYLKKRLSAVRCFARYLAVRDGRTEVPDRHLIAKAPLRQKPYLYSQQKHQEHSISPSGKGGNVR